MSGARGARAPAGRRDARLAAKRQLLEEAAVAFADGRGGQSADDSADALFEAALAYARVRNERRRA